jgi:hypothetical protein
MLTLLISLHLLPGFPLLMWRSLSGFTHRANDCLHIRDISGPGLVRTAIAAIIPRTPAVDPCQIIYFDEQAGIADVLCFLACFNSLVFDYCARQKVSGNHWAIFILKQLPMYPSHLFSDQDYEFIVPRALELTFTAWDLILFANEWRETSSQRERACVLEWMQDGEIVQADSFSAPPWAEHVADLQVRPII